VKNLIRTKGGTFIHRGDCRMAQRGNGELWLWAEGVGWDQIAWVVRRYNYRTCSKCRPLAARD